MVTDALMLITAAVVAVYGGATLLASIRFVPEGNVGVVTSRTGERRSMKSGVHFVNPFTTKTSLVPRGPMRMDGEVRNVVTRDGWNISAHYQINAKLEDEMSAHEAGDDWRQATKDATERVLRTELENNDAADLRPRPQALDEGVVDEINILTRRWGVEVDWLRTTIRWAYAVPPAHVAPRP
jgi:regulator of protease activity HflC (stomatin/prohibitin superfamily)